MSPHAVKILLIDDQISSLLALEDILSDLDAVLIKAASGKEALLTMLDQEIDCILLDVSMPGMDGFEFLKTLQKAPAHAKIPVIMVTGKIFSENETLKAYQHGAVDFLFKPLDTEMVYRKVSFFVQQARRIKGLQAIEGKMQRLAVDVIKPLQAVRDDPAGTAAGDPGLGDIVSTLEALKQTWDAFAHEKSSHVRS